MNIRISSVPYSKKILMFTSDIGLFILSFACASLIRKLTKGINDTSSVVIWDIKLLFMAAIYSFIFYIHDLYSLQEGNRFTELVQKTVQAFFIASLLSISVLYLKADPNFMPKTIFIIFNAMYFVLFLAWRSLAAKFFRSLYPSIRLAFLGWHPLLVEIFSDKKIRFAFNMKFSIIYPGIEKVPETAFDDIPFIYNLEEFDKALNTRIVDTVVISPYIAADTKIIDTLFNNLHTGVRYVTMAEFYEVVMRRIPLDAISQIWFLEHVQLKKMFMYDYFKRFSDIIISFTALVMTIMVWPFIALTVRLSGKGPVFYRQTRSGLLGKEFSIIKFRTMRTDCNDGSITKENDGRITAIGKFLRQSRLDELPQLINILFGEMSFVGPRPERPELIDNFIKQVPFYRQRLLVKPGLTGWDQVCGEYHSATVKDTFKKVQYDFYYIKNRSLYLDIKIMIKTIGIVLSRAGR